MFTLPHPVPGTDEQRWIHLPSYRSSIGHEPLGWPHRTLDTPLLELIEPASKVRIYCTVDVAARA